MSIVSTKLMGGLGNYVFQISAAYSISLRDGKEMICDTSDIMTPHKPYTNYTNNIFRKVNFTDSLPPFLPIGESKFTYTEFPKIDGNIKIFGYFQSEKYFINYRKEILELFEIDGTTEKNLLGKYIPLLELDTCSLHIRRGDYTWLQNFHPLQSIEYYKESISRVGNEKHFLIFSDDIKWCEENLNFIENKTFITGNTDYEDLYLMSMCKHNIIANSTFSWWGAWLNKNDDKIVIAPSKWFGISNSHFGTSDLYCDKWVKI